MRTVFLVLVFLALIGWYLSSTSQPLVAAPDAQTSVFVDDGWRRTVDGWERNSDWQSTTIGNHVNLTYDLGTIHPLIVSSLVGLISLATLIWFEPQAASPIRDNN